MWLVGMDEAGYGPNLGPFVMSAVGCRLRGQPPACLWEALGAAVRRAGGKRDARLILDDSKRIYSSGKTLGGLERGIGAILGGLPPTLADLVARLAPEDTAELAEEIWYTGTTPLPRGVNNDAETQTAFRLACDTAGIHDWTVRSVIVCPPRFNRLIQRAGTKSIVLADAFVRLLRGFVESAEGQPLEVTADKQGGRNTYLLQIQQAVGGLVRVLEETEEESRYEALHGEAPVRVRFIPRADGANLCVAVASMVSKYVRELCMNEFNTFWCQHLPGLVPTAGYPGDAPRYLEAIRATAETLGVSHDAIWRER
jgi:ribonuclease HII